MANSVGAAGAVIDKVLVEVTSLNKEETHSLFHARTLYQYVVLEKRLPCSREVPVKLSA
jgi:hypothetical protein